MIIQAEVIIARNLSLKSKFTDSLLERPDAADELHHFVACVLQNSEVAVRGGPLGPAGTAIQKLFYSAQRVSLSFAPPQGHMFYICLYRENGEKIFLFETTRP